MNQPTVLYLSHGGGPLPLLGDMGHQELVDALKTIATMIAKPSAIIVVSAHWEENKPTITKNIHPSLIYDYYGFPKASYEIKYPVLGAPALADQLYSRFCDRGIEAALDERRGLDHGVFVPLKIMYPKADIPCLQLSLINHLHSREHIQMGEILSELDQENMLIIGSGFSFHNMKAFFSPATTDAVSMNEAFDRWLIDVCSNPSLTEHERTALLEGWESVPFARYCHPREEHLLPLHVCYGVTKRACQSVFEMQILGKKASCYLWTN